MYKDIIKRLESLEERWKPHNSLVWILKDGSEVPASGVNDPLNFIISGKDRPTVSPVSYKCTDIDGADPITDSIMMCAIECAKESNPV